MIANFNEVRNWLQQNNYAEFISKIKKLLFSEQLI